MSSSSLDALDDTTIDCVIKLGGSALTDKKVKETYNETLFDATIKSIVAICDRFRQEHGRRMRLIIVHGAGSFAHPHAKAGKVHLGIDNKESAEAVVFGLCDTRLGLHKLSRRILDAFIAEKTPVSLTSVFPGWKTHTVYNEGVKTSQTVEEHTCKTLLELVNLGVVPMLHGDCVMDTNQGTAVLSGDLILDTLARELRPKYVVYVSDVEGVFSRPPTTESGSVDPDAKIIASIDVHSDGSFEMPPTMISCIDVSGGMAGKLSAAASTAARGIPVYIVKGGTEDMVVAGLGHVPKKGTLMKPVDA